MLERRDGIIVRLGADPIERPKNWLGMRHKLFWRSDLGNVDGTSTLNSSHASNLESTSALHSVVVGSVSVGRGPCE